MAVLKVGKDGLFICSGRGFCGGTNFESRAAVMKCFNCEFCDSYRKEGLKIVDKRGEISLGRWLK